ncbi:hypothetical protein JTB14_014463 [Gonioctena quinquepunctata]|nr:hypothetical protein JTB14_014463 [Gonioctena quinquepunctata]
MSVIFSGLCWLYTLPGPSSITFQNGFYQAYPIDRVLCPEIDPFRDVIFELYTRNNPETPEILLTNNETSLKSSSFDSTEPTIMFFHGFLESSSSDDAVQMRDIHLQRGYYNVILVDMKRLLAGLSYPTAARNCLPIGKFCAEFVDFLVKWGLQLSTFQLIGHSLGAHIAGITGKNLRSGKAARVTGLDPAGPLFSFATADRKIERNDGYMVDILHTNAGLFGIREVLGSIDVWLNGGSKQPQCTLSKILKRAPKALLAEIGTFFDDHQI